MKLSITRANKFMSAIVECFNSIKNVGNCNGCVAVQQLIHLTWKEMKLSIFTTTKSVKIEINPSVPRVQPINQAEIRKMTIFIPKLLQQWLKPITSALRRVVNTTGSETTQPPSVLTLMHSPKIDNNKEKHQPSAPTHWRTIPDHKQR